MEERRCIIGFDMGSVNYAGAVIEHTPAEKRRVNASAALPPPVPEHTLLLSARFINLKADRVKARFDRRKGGDQTFSVAPRLDYESEVSTIELIRRLAPHLRAWRDLWELPLRDVWIEVPGGGKPIPGGGDTKEGQGAFVNWQLLAATIAIIAGIDAERGLGARGIYQSAKKADVPRGTKYSENKAHKALSIAAMTASARANGDLLALRFVEALDKQDDVCDAYNLARAGDDQPAPPTQTLKATRKRKKEEDEETVTPPKKKPRRDADSMFDD
jgi:hypothetical protein